jgi:hypothetical protein
VCDRFLTAGIDPIRRIEARMAFDRGDLEIDKLADCWVLTHWLRQRGVALRLKIFQRYENPDELSQEITAEIRFGPYGPFIQIATLEVSVDQILYGSDCPYSRWQNVLPSVFTGEFEGMLKAWAAISDIAMLGKNDVVRYGNKPDRDLYELLRFDRSALAEAVRH